MNAADFFTGLVAAGLLAGVPLFLAALGEIFAERSGVLNLGIEGMMLLAAMTGFHVALATGSPWLGLGAGGLAGIALAAIHAAGVVYCGGDPVVSGLALGFFGGGLAAVLGIDLVGRSGPVLPEYAVLGLSRLPLLGPALFRWNILVPLTVLLGLAGWLLLERSRFGLRSRAAGEAPEAARVLGVSVTGQRLAGTLIGGGFAGLAGASLSLAVTPGWVDNITGGQGWIAIGLVVFSRFKPWRAALGAFLFGALRRLLLDLQGIPSLPLFKNPNLGYFLAMIPYLLTIAVLVGEELSRRKRRLDGAPPCA
ncbi:MAG: ABC transporter permease [Myxococcales bacterium]|nr:ABC transporter permease [Myxococcales bacterium]